MTEIKLLNNLEIARKWDEYVQKNPQGCLWHSTTYLNVLSDTFGYRRFLFYAEEDQVVKGVLPLFATPSFFGGKLRLINIPVSGWCGAIGENPEIVLLLLAKARELADELNADYLELRQMQRIEAGLAEKLSYITFLYNLQEGSEILWAKMNRKTRGSIRKAKKNRLTVELDCADVDLFYGLYIKRLRDLGSPPYPRQFFIRLKNVFDKDALVTLVRQDNKIISACFSVIYKGTLHALLAGADRSFLPLNPYSLMYWRLIQRACECNLTWFDFGRSHKGAGSYHFKKNWGFPETQLHYQYYLRAGQKVPNLESGTLMTRLFQKTWRMMPLAVVKAAGPWIRKKIIV